MGKGAKNVDNSDHSKTFNSNVTFGHVENMNGDRWANTVDRRNIAVWT